LTGSPLDDDVDRGTVPAGGRRRKVGLQVRVRGVDLLDEVPELLLDRGEGAAPRSRSVSFSSWTFFQETPRALPRSMTA
jgi:hypothetical protein